eukprot:CAMPEP_0113693392 /NCGR_PEP_ID=MMETSP0038_2-20120614/19637_1 /TAXON_ID=2898 /ORGANISM="Cryptomonas paramecium" /LENGTH=205 /DNA_ID=CAMNT_0000615455 /DNA_START=206 /DNA_END=823 /DNA_ORIENTATION=+ /assembly_acc=CAM_ASM_000170
MGSAPSVNKLVSGSPDGEDMRRRMIGRQSCELQFDAQDLFSAVSRGDDHTMKLILAESNLFPNSCDDAGRTALHFACAAGKSQLVDLLIAAKADLNVRDHRGYEPLQEAIRGGHGDVVKTLVKAGVILSENAEIELEAEMFGACFLGDQFRLKRMMQAMELTRPARPSFSRKNHNSCDTNPLSCSRQDIPDLRGAQDLRFSIVGA